MQGSSVCKSTTISSVQEPCSTLAGVGHFGHRRFFAFCREIPEPMETDEETTMIDVPERLQEDLEINVPRIPVTFP